MSPVTLATVCGGLILLGLIAYAVLGGADFGGGIWDLFASGSSAERQRKLIANAMGPVWEANNVWLIYVIVMTFTCFPLVYAAISTALFIPIILALLGIVLRGAAFGFRSYYSRRAGIASVWGRIFSAASVITPFLLGMVAGAIAGGHIRVRGGQVIADYWSTWTTPFAFACGAFALGLCAVLAATYLSVEALDAGDFPLVRTFQAGAIVAGAITALIGAIAALLTRAEAPVLWRGLVGQALPFSLGAVLIGLGTAFCLLVSRYRLARILVAAETACILAAWGVAQYPYLVVPDLTMENAASPPNVLALAIIGTLVGMVVLLPSLWYLFRIFKSPNPPHPRLTAASFAQSLPSADQPNPLPPTPGAPADAGQGTPAQSDQARTDAQTDSPTEAQISTHDEARQEAPHLGPIPADRETLLLLPLAALLSLGVWDRLRDAYDRWCLRSRRARHTHQTRHHG